MEGGELRKERKNSERRMRESEGEWERVGESVRNKKGHNDGRVEVERHIMRH